MNYFYLLMAKFFRTLRIEAIQLQKARNYLFYAVGEIALVAIGILLALKVSNWNEDQNNLTKRELYYKNLISELVQDTTLISEKQTAWRAHLLEVKRFTDYASTQPNVDSLLMHLQYVTLYFSSIQGFNTATYETLISTGDFKLVGDSANFLLKKIKEEQAYHLDVFKKEQDGYLNSLNYYLSHFPKSNLLIRNEEAERQLWKHVSKEETLIALSSVVFLRRLLLSDGVRTAGNVKTRETSLLNYLNQSQSDNKFTGPARTKKIKT